MKTSLSSVLLAATGVASLAVAVPLSSARAQQETKPEPRQAREATPAPPQDTIAPAPSRQRFGVASPAPMAEMPMPPQQPWVVGGPAVMVADGNNLYILRGDRLFKVDKGDLRVVREGHLPPQPPMGEFAPNGGRIERIPMPPPPEQPGRDPARGGGGREKK